MNQDTQSEIGVAVCQTALGWAGIAWSAQGLVTVTLPHAREADALGGLPASRGSGTPGLPGFDAGAFAEKLQRYFAGEAVDFNEPLDPTIGTDFQQRVWTIVRAIPRGERRTYGQIACQAGSPGAARAVGQAMARNPWPPVVPCHRVVGHDGQLTGFGGGLAMKQQMLDMEAGS
jgi:methylated-DNA-[protein]-cysteine S-methyltransferase